MQRIFDDPSRVVEDMLTGWLKANEAAAPGPRTRASCGIGQRSPSGGLATDGGFGHEPAFLG